MAPGMKLVTRIMHDRVLKLPHLYKDTDDFLHKLSLARLTSDCGISKFDIKDFFMSGEHDSIVTSCKSQVKTDLAKVVGDGLKIFLSTQYVRKGNIRNTCTK
jgi:hypothetical protein